jgi:hypothetical protein
MCPQQTELKNVEFMQIEKLLHGETFGDDGSNGTRVPNWLIIEGEPPCQIMG